MTKLVSILFPFVVLLVQTNSFTDQFGNKVEMTWSGGTTNCAPQISLSTQVLSPTTPTPSITITR